MVMLFRFRISPDPDRADQAQGWIIASSELSAREQLGGEVHLQQQLGTSDFGVPEGTVFVTSGSWT